MVRALVPLAMNTALRVLVLALVAGSMTSCLRVERRSTSTGPLPAAMLGAWSGDWTSTSGGGNGGLALSVQMFEGQPVLQLDSAHPCLVSGNYRLVADGPILQLQRNGIPVFVAELDQQQRRLVGTYACAQDNGQWSASWTHELPPLGNIGGLWTGTFEVPSEPERTFTMQIEQEWNNGLLSLTGEVVVDGLGIGLPIESGAVFWTGDRFDLTLRASQLGAQVFVNGTGTTGVPMQANGLIFLTSQPTGTWSATRQDGG